MVVCKILQVIFNRNNVLATVISIDFEDNFNCFSCVFLLISNVIPIEIYLQVLLIFYVAFLLISRHS